MRSALNGRVLRRNTWPRQNPIEATLPYLPLRDALVAAELLREIDGTIRRRWAGRGIPVSVVDHICCTMLCRHPYEIYGDDWWNV